MVLWRKTWGLIRVRVVRVVRIETFGALHLTLCLEMEGIGYTNDIVLHRFVILQYLFCNVPTKMAWGAKNTNIHFVFNICLTMVDFIINYPRRNFFYE